MISLIQHFEADFLWKNSLKIMNSGIILKTFTHVTFKWEWDLNTNDCFGIQLNQSGPTASFFSFNRVENWLHICYYLQ